jgi:hypothetical protein
VTGVQTCALPISKSSLVCATLHTHTQTRAHIAHTHTHAYTHTHHTRTRARTRTPTHIHTHSPPPQIKTNTVSQFQSAVNQQEVLYVTIFLQFAAHDFRCHCLSVCPSHILLLGGLEGRKVNRHAFVFTLLVAVLRC